MTKTEFEETKHFGFIVTKSLKLKRVLIINFLRHFSNIKVIISLIKYWMVKNYTDEFGGFFSFPVTYFLMKQIEKYCLKLLLIISHLKHM